MPTPTAYRRAIRVDCEVEKRRARRQTPPPPKGGDRTAAPDRFYRDLVLSMPNGVLVIERDGTVAEINDMARRILGLARTSVKPGRHFRQVLGPDHEFTRVLSHAFDLRSLPDRSELRLEPSGPSVGFTVFRIADEAGNHVGAVLSFKDLTRVEQLEERERLRERLAALGETAAAIAHEVKDPLAGIQVMAGLLKRRLPAEDDQAVLGDIITEAQVANRIVVDLLEFVRPIDLEIDCVSIIDILRDTVDRLERHPGAAGVAVDTDLGDDLPTVSGDHTQLRQLFTNLLTNALEALGGCGRVFITTRFVPREDADVAPDDGALHGWVVVEIDDDGPGIPPDVTQRIFSPFFTTKPRGSGLGLAIVRRIVDAHDGRIDVGRSPRGGARFEISLPAGRPAPDPDATVDILPHARVGR